MHVYIVYREFYILAISSGVSRQQNIRELMGQWIEYVKIPKGWGGGGGGLKQPVHVG